MNIEQQIEQLQSQIDALRKQYKQQSEFEYPIYMQWLQDKAVVKFTSKNTGVVVVAGNSGSEMSSLGFSFGKWIPHTDENFWQPTTFDEERGIADKQLCECWGTFTHQRLLRFYDAKNKSTFSHIGTRNDHDYDNYRPIPYAEYPDWAIEAEKTLED